MRLRVALVAALLGAAGAGAAEGTPAPAEAALFQGKHLARVKPPTTIGYALRAGGSLNPAFDDRVTLALSAAPDGGCCAASAEFLTPPRQLQLPPIDKAEANPVILYFLERDVREMTRLTGGQSAHFRKRIRLALADAATLSTPTLRWRGVSVAATQIRIEPYRDDPMRNRFARYAGKQYLFTLSDAVPGGVYAIAVRIDGEAAGAAPLLTEELLLDGAETTLPH